MLPEHDFSINSVDLLSRGERSLFLSFSLSSFLVGFISSFISTSRVSGSKLLGPAFVRLGLLGPPVASTADPLAVFRIS